MNKDLLLKSIADAGYNVGFGGRKHWATYDIVDKVPGLIGFVSMAFGIYALVYDELSAKYLSAALLVIGLMGLYISFYDHKKGDYEKSANKLTCLYNELRNLYREVQSSYSSPDEYLVRLKAIESEYYDNCISKQILFSDWYAHYKFFWQYQIGWVNEQKDFKFFRDMVPLSFTCWVVLLVVALVVWVVKNMGFGWFGC
ncbi:SLATT domain-containing protein [Pseudomonas sp. BN102]|uniref:SLATT domain-containing protein n=1 Tax=Pseudomonas sp. BN102 TaxID=2567886 RepID=UPI00245809E3|nr:SLATT domain-containing protein [Pseudomonas sp. BN102]MDH4611746.1 SLATT domain-containing protein [Pseudomonas sp. BN102]